MGISTSNRIGNDTSFNGVNSNNSTNSTKSKSDENIRDTFQSIMGLVNVSKSSDYSVQSDKTQTVLSDSKSSGSKSASNSTSAYKKESQQYSTDSKVKSSDSTSAASDKAGDKAGAASSVKKTTQANTSGNTQTSDGKSGIDENSDVAEKIIESVAGVLNVTPEQVQQSMDDLGLDVNDLLDSEGVQQLVLDIQGADNIDMLVDESLGQYMTEISDNISEILDANALSDVQPQLETELSGSADIIDEAKDDRNLTSDRKTSGETTGLNDTDVKSDAVNTNPAAVDEAVDSSKADERSLTSENTTQTETGAAVETSQSASQGSDTASQNQQGNSLDSSLVNNIAQALTDAVSQSGEVSDFDGDVEAADIVRQVVDEIKANINDKVRSLELRLNPENLGRVQITVSTKNGVMQAKIIAENEAAKNAIEGSLSLLKETFNEQDLKVEAVEVTIASYDFFKEDNEATDNENKQKNTSSGGNNNTGNDDIVKEDISDAEKLERDMMQQSGNSISYTV